MEGEIRLGSGYEIAGRIKVPVHPASLLNDGHVDGDIISCRSCGACLLPPDQSVHEDFHTIIDRYMNMALGRNKPLLPM